MKRCAGVFLHPSSLPSPFGIGDFGDEAFTWIDLLVQYKQMIWQICPLGPVGYGNSPYNSLSAFAGNHLLLSPQKLHEDGLLTRQELDAFPKLPDTSVDYSRVSMAKEKLFKIAYSRFKPVEAYEAFLKKEKYWLNDYALFMTLKKKNKDKPWNQWDVPLRLRFPAIIQEIENTEHDEIEYQKFLQYFFFHQWNAVRSYAHQNKVEILGDVPFYAAYDSADVWAWADTFDLDDNGNPTFVGGVPPDYFSATGQLWGNPVYRWDEMKDDEYRWWFLRIHKMLECVDWIRIDHFRGFESYWAVPFGSATAAVGHWMKGPGIEFFTMLKKKIGKLPFVAEDLGMITPQVNELRTGAGMPGMRVLQFAFDGDNDNPHRPHNIGIDSVIYTGTHDNNTTVGWWNSQPDDRRQFMCRYLGCSPDEIMERLLRTACMSPALWCIIPLQDVLELDRNHRMNTPGTADGNWEWRYTGSMIRQDLFSRLAFFSQLYGRA